MKKLIVTACAAIASAMAFASTVESSNTFGVLKVSTGLNGTENRRQFMISVPWEAVGSGAIKAKDLVLASNLANGDKLYAVSSDTDAKFDAWVVADGAWTAADSAVVVGADGVATKGASNLNATVARGSTVLVVETAQSEIYLSGQYNEVATAAITLAAGSATLIGAGLPKDYTLVDSMFSATPNADDTIFADGAFFWRKNNKWVMNGTDPETGRPAQVSAVLEKGKGAWYFNAGDSAITITFN